MTTGSLFVGWPAFGRQYWRVKHEFTPLFRKSIVTSQLQICLMHPNSNRFLTRYCFKLYFYLSGAKENVQIGPFARQSQLSYLELVQNLSERQDVKSSPHRFPVQIVGGAILLLSAIQSSFRRRLDLPQLHSIVDFKTWLDDSRSSRHLCALLFCPFFSLVFRRFWALIQI